MAEEDRAGILFWEMRLDNAQFKKGIKDAQESLKKAGAQITDSFKKISKASLIVGTAIAATGAGMLLFARNTLAATNAQLLLADSIGSTQKEIAGLELLTQKFGVETGMVIDKMREVGGLDEFKKLAEQVRSAGDEQAQLNKSVELFGGEGAKMLPILQQGAAGFAAMEAEAVRLGLALSPQQIAESRVAWEELESTIFAIKGLGKQIGTAFAKPLGTMAAGIKAFIATFKDDILAGVKLAADLLTKMIMGAFNLFSRFGIPFINGFISFANQIGVAFETLFAFLSPATNAAVGGLSEMFDTVTAFIATFKQSMIIGITKPIQFIIKGAFNMLAKLARVLQKVLGEMAFGLAELGVISDKSAGSVVEGFGDLATELTLAGRAIAKPFGDAQKQATEEMEDILTKQALKNQKQQQKFGGIMGKFGIKFGDALKDAGKVAEKVTKAIAGTSVSDQFAGLALTGSQEAQNLMNDTNRAFKLDQERNKLLKGLLKKDIGEF